MLRFRDSLGKMLSQAGLRSKPSSVISSGVTLGESLSLSFLSDNVRVILIKYCRDYSS